MAERQSDGRFAPGNTIGRGRSKERMAVRKAGLSKLQQAFELLDGNYSSLESQLANPENTNWVQLVLGAVKKENYKFIVWVFEMLLGRPSQNVEMHNPTSEDNERLKEEIVILREKLSEEYKREY